jgi:Cu+-exporting ATPase
MDQIVTQNAALQDIDLAIGGMTCASCVARVEKTLGRVEGVAEVSVNLATERAHIRARPGVAVAALGEAVRRAGYTATPHVEARPGAGQREEAELAAAILLSLPIAAAMLWPVPGWVQLALATPVQFWLGARFYIAGARALRAGTGNMDLLVALGTSAAYGLSVFELFAQGPLYFEAAAAVITLVRLGKYLEGRAKREAANSVLGLAHLRPEVAHLVDGGDTPTAKLRPGDEIIIRPGERVPADGVILRGEGSLDESHLTGESAAVARGPGENLLAGSLNLDAVLALRVTQAAGEGFIDRMARLIDAAQSSKPRIQQLADRVAAIFVPVVVAIAIATFAGWLLAGAAPARAVLNAVSVLVIACPCALGLATPAAILAGTGAGARHGILLRNAEAIERAARVSRVFFDKTGTLTQGRPALRETLLFNSAERDAVLRIAGGLAAADTHPLSLALHLPDAPAAEAVRILPGRGITGRIAGVTYLLGSARLMAESGIAVPPASGSASWSYLAAEQKLLAGFGFTDALRPGARAAVDRLRALGLGVALLSGDREAAARAAGEALGITDIIAEASPEQKLGHLQAAQAGGDIVAMVGDGVNDAAALAAADLGIAIGAGADVAIEAADISLLRPEPGLVADALVLAARTRAVLVQGLFWALIYNVIGIPAAAFGLLSPVIAGAAMAASSICVLTNALRLRRWRPA